MEDINSLFSDLKAAVELFYQKNADLDASGQIHMGPILNATNKLDLYLKGDYKALWQVEREDAKKLQDEMEDILEFKTHNFICSIGDELNTLRRELKIMTRCTKRISENYRKECADHEATKLAIAKIDSLAPLETGTSNHVHPFPHPLPE
jgi:hypothetical protein